jgi:hypothetical protein
MYFDALSFLEDEREAWRPFEELLEVPGERFTRPVAAAHDWSARDLLGHLVAYQAHCLEIARELAVGERSPALEAMQSVWEQEADDALNDELLAAWGSMPDEEVRRRAREIPGELRGYLTVVPETRWVKHPVHGPHLEQELLDHYADHRADLEAILAAADQQ